MKHELKILPEYFQDIVSGIKTFEVRYNDRNYQVGDILILREWINDKYTGNCIEKKVIYILDNLDYVKEGYVIMGLDK